MTPDNTPRPDPVKFTGQHSIPKGDGEVFELADETVSQYSDKPSKVTEKNVVPRGSGEVFDLEEESMASPSQQKTRSSSEHVIEQGSGEALALADPKDAGPGRPSVEEIKKFLKKIPTEGHDPLDEANLKQLISEGVSLVQRQREAQRNPEDKLKVYQSRADRLNNAHAALLNALKGLSELYDNPKAVLDLFAGDVQKRAGVNYGNAAILGNEVDIARMTFLRASRIGLEESDIVAGRKKEPEASTPDAPPAKKPFVRTQEEKDREREAKKARLKAGNQVPAEAAAPKEEEPKENDLIDNVDRTQDTRRLEDSKPGPEHALYETLRSELRKLTRGPGDDNPELLRLRLSGQTTARIMAEWIVLEIKCCGSKSPVTEPDVAGNRAKAVTDKLKPALVTEAKIDESLRRAMKILGKITKERELDLGFLSRQATTTFESLISSGIRHSEPSVSEEALSNARRERQAADQERSKAQERWKNDRFRRDGNEPPVGGGI